MLKDAADEPALDTAVDRTEDRLVSLSLSRLAMSATEDRVPQARRMIAAPYLPNATWRPFPERPAVEAPRKKARADCEYAFY